MLFFLRLLTLSGTGLMCLCLYRRGLSRRYLAFFSYLIFTTIRSSILLSLDIRGLTYYKVWVCSEPVLWFFYVLLVLELYSLVLENHSGLCTLGRWTLYGALSVSVCLSALSLLPGGAGPAKQTLLLHCYYLIERGIVFSLVIFLFLMLMLLTRYPVPLSRNVIVHSMVYSLYFLSITMGWLVWNVLGFQVSRPVNTFFTIVTVACLIGWLTLITREGEARVMTVHHSWEPGQEERLVGQLDAINATLLRAARK